MTSECAHATCKDCGWQGPLREGPTAQRRADIDLHDHLFAEVDGGNLLTGMRFGLLFALLFWVLFLLLLWGWVQ